MKAYNIGENLDFMHMDSNPGYAALSRTPKLKRLSLANLGIDILPLHVCPALQSVQYGALYCEELDEMKRLQSQGYIVMHSIDFRFKRCQKGGAQVEWRTIQSQSRARNNLDSKADYTRACVEPEPYRYKVGIT
jgi:hypothetical protein